MPPYRVAAKWEIGQNFYTVTGLVQLMSGQQPPAAIAFPRLGTPANTHNLGEGQGMAVQMSPMDEVTRATGLHSCASVCYLNAANGLAYVYHANAGSVSFAEFRAAMVAIVAGVNYGTVYIAYAHRQGTDHSYQQNINNLIAWGVPAANIVEITDLFLNEFGMNNHLQIGY